MPGILKIWNGTEWIEVSTVVDHGSLSGLSDDDHTQYLLEDGSRPMGGNLDMSFNDIENPGDVDGVSISSLESTFTGHTGNAIAHPSLISDLSDININTPTSGDYLIYDGSNWNNTLRESVNLIKDTTTITLASAVAKINVSGASMTGNTNNWELFDSGSGFEDSLRYTGTRDIAVFTSANFMVKHTAADNVGLEARALSYINDTIQNGGHIYASTTPNENSIESSERTTRMTLSTNDYINYRANYTNAAGTVQSSLDAFSAAFTDSGSVNITSTAITIALDTTEVSSSNYTLNGDGSISIVVAGNYVIGYSIPVADDSTAGGIRARIFSHVEYDDNDDGAGYVVIAQSRAQDYARETSGGEGVSSSFIFTATASSRIRLIIDQSGTVDLSSETGEAQVSIHRLSDGTDGASDQGQILGLGFQLSIWEP